MTRIFHLRRASLTDVTKLTKHEVVKERMKKFSAADRDEIQTAQRCLVRFNFLNFFYVVSLFLFFLLAFQTVMAILQYMLKNPSYVPGLTNALAKQNNRKKRKKNTFSNFKGNSRSTSAYFLRSSNCIGVVRAFEPAREGACIPFHQCLYSGSMATKRNYSNTARSSMACTAR